MDLTTLDKALWAASFFGHAALLLVLVLRRRAREFPVFTSFVASLAFSTVLLFLISHFGNRHTYFVAYWVSGFANYALQIGIIFEIARIVLRPTGTWILDARRSFLAWGSVGLVLAAALSLRMGPPEAKGFDLWDARVNVFTALLLCELFLAMSVAANRLGLQRRNYVVAISQGLTVWAATSLLTDFGHILLGWNRDFIILDHIGMVAYLGALVFWIVSFWLPERLRAPLSADMQDYLLALQRRVHYDFDRTHLG